MNSAARLSSAAPTALTQEVSDLIADDFRVSDVCSGARGGRDRTMAGLADCNVYIVTVPTAIDKHEQPDLRPLESASTIVGKVVGPGDLVVYESTV